MEDVISPVDQTLLTHPSSLVLVIAVVFLCTMLVLVSRLSPSIKVLLCIGLGLRLVGAVARFQVLQLYYGVGDASGYFGRGYRYAESFRQLDFTPLTAGIHWYGTDFVRSVSGLVIAIIGPSMFAEFIVFSIIAFLGLIAFAIAFRRSYPSAQLEPYLLWTFCFPSLWFWPSSVGKEALILLGLGLTVMGFAGSNRRINWPLFALGLVTVYAVRPQVIPVLLVALTLAQWLSFTGGWTTRRIVQGVAMLIVGIIGINYGLRTAGIEQLDLEGITEFVESDKSREVAGGTSISAVSTGLQGIPVAIFNILFRPLPWEATNIMVLLSSLEMMTFWLIVIVRRQKLIQSLRHWRSDRMLRLSFAFVLIYSVALGMMLINVGIIARQRILLYPFFFLLIEAQPYPASKRAPKRLWGAVRSAPRSRLVTSTQQAHLGN